MEFVGLKPAALNASVSEDPCGMRALTLWNPPFASLYLESRAICSACVLFPAKNPIVSRPLSVEMIARELISPSEFVTRTLEYSAAFRRPRGVIGYHVQPSE